MVVEWVVRAIKRASKEREGTELFRASAADDASSVALRSVLLSDRAVYKAGDPLHLHGYVRLVERGTLASPATPPRLRIS